MNKEKTLTIYADQLSSNIIFMNLILNNTVSSSKFFQKLEHKICQEMTNTNCLNYDVTRQKMSLLFSYLYQKFKNEYQNIKKSKISRIGKSYSQEDYIFTALKNYINSKNMQEIIDSSLKFYNHCLLHVKKINEATVLSYEQSEHHFQKYKVTQINNLIDFHKHCKYSNNNIFIYDYLYFYQKYSMELASFLMLIEKNNENYAFYSILHENGYNHLLKTYYSKNVFNKSFIDLYENFVFTKLPFTRKPIELQTVGEIIYNNVNYQY